MSAAPQPTPNTLIFDEDDVFEDFDGLFRPHSPADYRVMEVDDSELHFKDNWEDDGQDEFTQQIRASLMEPN